jgi:dTDP-4-dehydrorhamnose 3,5-epimerase
VKFIEGKSFKDSRGTLHCVNEFSLEGIKRFYQIQHSNTSTIRAWQGHKIEHKYFFVPLGSFLIAWVQIDNFENPSTNLVAEHTMLSADKPGVLVIPAGYANGIKAIEAGSLLSIYSNLTLKESEEDRWSFDSSLWMKWPL